MKFLLVVLSVIIIGPAIWFGSAIIWVEFRMRLLHCGHCRVRGKIRGGPTLRGVVGAPSTLICKHCGARYVRARGLISAPLIDASGSDYD